MTAKNDLYQRYMRAFQDSTEHTSNCESCQNSKPCKAGAPLHERLARLQDAYNNALRHRR
ncbi:hypothetical protein I5Q34_26730 [Streptomyces sp. AV19]|uniref:hypothetical protein n=1 Tax=Streptomyces sp. AV19 TaxID=2793068 RepID=UPI0018FEA5C4|nr:hypothetical protein [Streptomyces sp. AV19]MBH1937823.1 hypothetical protein [Streptomyces sp. AV19]MDG4537101.1 hypothetical protein [Streptomyces sp. AV19]